MTISIMNNERLSETICITIGDLKRTHINFQVIQFIVLLIRPTQTNSTSH